MWMALVWSACVVGGGSTTWEFVQPDSLTVLVASGDIDVRSSPDDLMIVDWEGGGVGDNARPDVSDVRGDVVIDANGGIAGGGSVMAEVPDGTTLNLEVARGSIDVELEAPANITACVAAGSVRLVLPPGPYEMDLNVAAGVIGQEVFHEEGAPYRLSACAAAGEIRVEAN